MFNESIVDLDGAPLELLYSASLPGASAVAGGHYIEFNFFTGQAFLDGSGVSMLAGLDMRSSDFFPLIPGDNDIALIGCTGTVLSNGAWA